MDNEKSQKSRRIFICNNCEYRCYNKNDYKKHTHTIKHKKSENANVDNEKSQKVAKPNLQVKPDTYKCICGKWYQYNSGLCKHRRQCKYLVNIPEQTPCITVENTQFIKLLHQNQEFKEMILDQNKTITELSNRVSMNSITNNSNTQNITSM
jgi:hypothetical protein